MKDKAINGLELMREPFLENQIGKLPKPSKAQTAEVKADYKKGIRCKLCGQWHHPDVVHLNYVGHAALTDRLLDADPMWTWEPFAISEDGLPAFDKTGGLWIKLTVCGHTRLGYGHAASSEYKDIGGREKEVIGDALRNAAMRFGAALDLWHKGELHEKTEEQKKNNAVDAAIKSLERTGSTARTRQDAPRTTKPPDPAHTAEQSEEQLLKALKVKLGKKMEGLNDDEKKSLYAYSVGDKPVTPVLLQGIIDNYSTFKKDWEDMV